MAQGKPSSLGSRLVNAGSALLYSYPVHGKKTFKPSGTPGKVDERRITWDDVAIEFVPKTREERDAWDASLDPEYLRRVLEEGRHWERLRFYVNKSPRARKRALERERRRAAASVQPKK
jgi:hypothetical protein